MVLDPLFPAGLAERRGRSAVSGEWFELEEVSMGETIMEYVEAVIDEGFSDLPDEDAPSWPNWLFGNKPEAEARGEYVTEKMADIGRKVAFEGGVGLASDLASIIGFDDDWAMIYDVAMTYAIRMTLHGMIAYKHPEVSTMFLDEDYTRGTLVTAVNEAVINTLDSGEEEDE